MRYHVTLATALELVTYDVEGVSEEEAGSKAAARHLVEHPEVGRQDVVVAKIVVIGGYFAFPRGGGDVNRSSDQPKSA